ncbi:MAG: acetate--CoA ligase alpha subunit, partial [Anaerolineae bacterium]
MIETFSTPKSIAVIGASRETDKLGYSVLNNIVQYGYPGKVYPINPKADEILGLKCYPSVLDVPDPIELAVIVIPAKYVAAALEECGQKGIKGVIIISAGFRETGSEGAKMERTLIEIARKYNIRMVGPNVLGVIDTVGKMNASFAAGMPKRGKIAFMSQSGALCTSILDMALAQNVGFSRFVSLGNKADLNEIDFMEAWGDDPESRVIMAYLEGIANGARFMDIARRVTKRKPMIAVKSGTTSAGSRAVSSHTGTLAGSERAYDAAFSQAGVIRAGSVQDLFDYAAAFARQPLLKGDAIAIITNAGGPGIMASDAVERAGLRLAALAIETKQKLQVQLPAAASVANPVDVLGDALADRYALAIEAVLADPNVDALLVVLTPQTMTQIPETAEALGRLSKAHDKPVFGAFMGDASIQKGVQVLRSYDVPNYQVPERAVAAIAAMWRYRQWLNTPPLAVEPLDVDREKVARLFARVRSEGRVTIGDAEAREVLEAYGIPLPKAGLAATADEAVALAEAIGYPVVMKIASPDIL